VIRLGTGHETAAGRVSGRASPGRVAEFSRWRRCAGRGSISLWQLRGAGLTPGDRELRLRSARRSPRIWIRRVPRTANDAGAVVAVRLRRIMCTWWRRWPAGREAAEGMERLLRVRGPAGGGADGRADGDAPAVGLRRGGRPAPRRSGSEAGQAEERAPGPACAEEVCAAAGGGGRSKIFEPAGVNTPEWDQPTVQHHQSGSGTGFEVRAAGVTRPRGRGTNLVKRRQGAAT